VKAKSRLNGLCSDHLAVAARELLHRGRGIAGSKPTGPGTTTLTPSKTTASSSAHASSPTSVRQSEGIPSAVDLTVTFRRIQTAVDRIDYAQADVESSLPDRSGGPGRHPWLVYDVELM
jgi:hypothetical protein